MGSTPHGSTALRLPIKGRLPRVAIYLLAGCPGLMAIVMALFLAGWYWMSGAYLEPWLARTWTWTDDLWFLLVPAACFVSALAVTSWRASRIPAPFPIARLPAGQKRPIGVWIRMLIDLASVTSRVRGRLLWLARRLRHEDPERTCTLDELSAIVNGHRRVWVWIVAVVVAVIWLTIWPVPAAETLARWIDPNENGGYRVVGAGICSRFTRGCIAPDVAPPVDNNQPIDMSAAVAPAGELVVTLDAHPRTRPVIRVVSTDARSYVWLNGDSEEFAFDCRATVYGRQLVVRYRFAETELTTRLRIDVLTAGGALRQQVELRLTTEPPNFGVGSPTGGL
jgi:hypothetical protein